MVTNGAKKGLAVLLIVTLLVGMILPHYSTSAASKDIKNAILDKDILVGKTLKLSEVIGAFTVDGKKTGFTVNYDYSGVKNYLEYGLNGLDLNLRFKKAGKYSLPVTFKDKATGKVIATRNYTLVVVDDPVQVEIDNFLRMIFFASNPNAECYTDPEVIGYFTANNKACTKHTSNCNGCDNCHTLSIVKTDWFKSEYPLQAQTASSKLAGVGKSCFAFAFTLIDCILRSNTRQDVNSKGSGNRVSGKLNKAFCDKYVKPGDALLLNGHYAVVYSYNKDTGLITIVESNRDSKHHCSVYKKTYTLSGNGAYPYAGKSVERRRYVAT